MFPARVRLAERRAQRRVAPPTLIGLFVLNAGGRVVDLAAGVVKRGERPLAQLRAWTVAPNYARMMIWRNVDADHDPVSSAGIGLLLF